MSGNRARLPLALLALAALVVVLAWLGGGWQRPEAERTVADGASDEAPPLATVDGAGSAASLAAGGRPPSRSGTPDAAPIETSAEPSAGPFRGVCFDEHGSPVEGATIHVVSGIGTFGGGIDPGRFVDVRSAADGSFEIPGPADVASLRVRVTAVALAPVRSDEELTRAEVRRIVLVKACEIRVRVLAEADGAAVRGARVSAYAGRESGAGSYVLLLDRSTPLAEGVTDADGRVGLSTPGGLCGVLVLSREYAPGWRHSLSVPPGGVDLVVTVSAGTTWTGRVVEGSGKAIPGARVRAKGPLGWTADLTADADGWFRLEHMGRSVPPNTDAMDQQLRVAAYVSGLPRAFDIYKVAGSDREIALIVRPWGLLEGIVQSASGIPVPGARVRSGRIPPPIDLPWSLDGEPWPETKTDALGHFTLDRWSEPEGLAVFADGPEGGGWTGSGVPSASTKQLRVTLEAPMLLEEDLLALPSTEADPGRRVRLLDAAQAPVAGAWLEVGVVLDRLNILDRQRTDADGRATLMHLRPGRVTVVVHPPSGPSFDVLLDVDAKRGGETVLSVPTGVLAGHVFRLDGTPARVGLRFERVIRSRRGDAARLGNGTAATDQQGAFRCVGLGQGEYEVKPADEAFTLWAGPHYVFAGDQNLRYVAVTAAEVETLYLDFELLDAETGRPVPSLDARVYLAGYVSPLDPHDYGLPLVLVPGEQTWRTRDPLPPGTWEIRLQVGDYSPITLRDIRIPDGDRRARRSLRLESLGQIEGIVVRTDGRPLMTRVVVEALRRKGDVRADGTFSLALAPPSGNAPVTVTASGNYVGPTSTNVTLDNGRRTGIRLEVTEGGAIWVVLAEGRVPTRDARIDFQPMDAAGGAQGASVVFDHDSMHLGALRVIPGLLPGVYRVTGTWDDVALPAREVEVRTGETTTLNVREP